MLDGFGAGKTSDVIAALSWCLQNQAKYQIRVINLSLGHPVYESYRTDPLCHAVEACVRTGMVVVVSAGNYGKDERGRIYGGITSPGNDPAAITVGAVALNNSTVRSDDYVASYSSCGPTAIDGLVKPDIVAPGNKLVSASLVPVALATSYPANLVVAAGAKTSGPYAALADSYYTMSGTSMAAGVVTGTAALMLQANPSLTPNAVKAILTYTAQKLTQPGILGQGNGYLNAEGAVRLASIISQNSGAFSEGAQ